MILLRWLFLLALLAAVVLLILQVTAPSGEARRLQRVRRALREVQRRSRRAGPEGRALSEQARQLAAALERLVVRSEEVRRFLEARELDTVARRRLEEHLAGIEAQFDRGTALLERLAAELWTREPLDLPEAAARLTRTRAETLRALQSPTEEEGVN